MSSHKTKRDKRFPLFAHDNLLRRLFGKPEKYCSYVKQGQMVADLGCGPGYYTLALAKSVGPEGLVYAVDSDERAVCAVENKAAKHGYKNIEARASSAADLSFIEDGSVDFVLADGLLCSMAPTDHESAVREIRRIMKPRAKAFLKVAKGSMSYVGKAEWEMILAGFDVEQRNDGSFLDDRWAIVSKKTR
ncbi:MAG: class I SAM-dependent methyltransferase [candidate division WOR-3 bacterium]|nr:class I SAM-dependent methyltransferase [candidate division WOR-3 bacterium]